MMVTVIGIFEQRNVGRALSALYDQGFDKKEITVVDRERVTTGPLVPDQNAMGMAPGIAGANSTSGMPAALPVFAWETGGYNFLGLGIPQAAQDFYRSALHNGSTLIIVRTKDDRAEMARQIMRDAHATNVTEPPPNKQAKV